ncbi:regulatory YrvL family protein [Massilimicrobiota timonensis]|uniref:regulatory YrvL family protein n=1 Tax=Massilimicrobiota timonensis TaxID=1776392 RepID=UPI0023AB0B3C|nr:regulatory YrvL family protein [Massilimicrobiota timonensis]
MQINIKKLGNTNKEKIVTFLIGGVLVVGVLSIIALICGAVMRLFGFYYTSVGSVVLFFIIATIISYPLNLLASALPKALLALEKINKQSAVIMYLLLDTVATFIGLNIVDYFMQSISATTISIIIVSFVLALFGMSEVNNFNDKWKSR